MLPPGAADFDLLARHGERQVAIQVKASVGGHYRGPPVSIDAPVKAHSDEWFVLVTLDPSGKDGPAMYCVSARVVHVFAWVGWRRHAKTDHGTTSFNFRDFAHYQDRFDLLEPDALDLAWDFEESGGLWNWIADARSKPELSCYLERVPKERQHLPPLAAS